MWWTASTPRRRRLGGAHRSISPATSSEQMQPMTVCGCVVASGSFLVVRRPCCRSSEARNVTRPFTPTEAPSRLNRRPHWRLFPSETCRQGTSLEGRRSRSRHEAGIELRCPPVVAFPRRASDRGAHADRPCGCAHDRGKLDERLWFRCDKESAMKPKREIFTSTGCGCARRERTRGERHRGHDPPPISRPVRPPHLCRRRHDGLDAAVMDVTTNTTDHGADRRCHGLRPRDLRRARRHRSDDRW